MTTSHREYRHVSAATQPPSAGATVALLTTAAAVLGAGAVAAAAYLFTPLPAHVVVVRPATVSHAVVAPAPGSFSQ